MTYYVDKQYDFTYNGIINKSVKEKTMRISLSDHFDCKKMLCFTLPSIIMMVFTSIYGVVDGFFVSNFVGKTAFAAVNFIMPFLMLLGPIGFMFGTGGSALIAKTLGEGDSKKANKLFSMFVYITVAVSIIITVISLFILRPVAQALGAEGQMLEDCVLYGRIIIITLPFLMLQFEFQSFFITAEKPKLGLYSTIASGVTNMVLDFLFMAIFNLGVAGAATATALSQVVGGIIPIIYFTRPNTSLLKLGAFEFDGRSLFKACTNGSSELMSNISMSLVGILYNIQLLKYAGENGVAAYGVLMYLNFIFISVFIGFTVGIAPVIGFHYGAKNFGELQGLRKKSTVIIMLASAVMLVLGETLAYPLSFIFVGYDAELTRITLRGFSIYSFSFLFAGMAIFGSAFFTALNDGLTSALISFFRTLVFQVAAVMILPHFFDIDGIWISVVAAEVMAVVITVFFMVVKKKKYNY